MADLVYPPVIAAARTMFRVLDNRIRIEGAEHIRAGGGAVIACNHVSYLDFIFCGLGGPPCQAADAVHGEEGDLRQPHRPGRSMRGMHHISVDRSAKLPFLPRGAREAAVRRRWPRSRSHHQPAASPSRRSSLGAVRMAAAAHVPAVPMALWGTQRLWTKGRPKDLTRRHVPVSILIGEPMHPAKGGDWDVVTKELRTRMSAPLQPAQDRVPGPAGVRRGPLVAARPPGRHGTDPGRSGRQLRPPLVS